MDAQYNAGKAALDMVSGALRAFNAAPRQITGDEFDTIINEANDLLLSAGIK